MNRAILLLALPVAACFSNTAYLGEGRGGDNGAGEAEGIAVAAGGTASDPGSALPPPWLIVYEGTDTSDMVLSVSGLTLASNGDLVAAGVFTGRIDFDPGAGSDFREIPYAETPNGSQIGGLFVTRLDPTNVPVWTRTYEGAGDFEGSLAVDLDGSVLIAGEYIGTVDFDPGPGVDLRTSVGDNGPTNAFVTKLSAAGDALWTRTIGGRSSAKVAVLPNGNVVAFGYFVGSVDFDPGAGLDERTSDTSIVSDTADGYLLELDSNGNLVRPAFTFGGPDWDEVRQVRIDAAGNRYLIGEYSQGADLDPGPVELRGAVNGNRPYGSFVTALDPRGALRWSRTYDQVRLREMVLGPSGCFITGIFHDGSDLDPGAGEDIRHTVPKNADDWFLSKLDATGNVQWTRDWVAHASDPELPLVAFDDGSVTTAVTYNNVANEIAGGIDGEALPPSTPGWAVALFSFAHDGATQSRRYFVGEGWEMCLSAAAAPNGRLLLGGVASGGSAMLDAGQLPTSARRVAGYVASVSAQ